jgi:putative glutamine amidotransferase
MKIATHQGSCYEQARRIARNLNCQMVDVTSREAAHEQDFDMLLLLGGTDVSPFFYGERLKEGTQRPDVKRDTIEWTLCRRALADGQPILGICRGHQLLAVAAGGSLYQDMKDALHVQHAPSHRLSEITYPLGDAVPTMTVNSYHHQAVRTCPPGFQVAAATADGVTEAIYLPGRAVGVQWHPEMLVFTDPRWMDLFVWWREGFE